MATSEDFEPIWQIGVFDAHCHPTDIMESVQRIPKMKAKALTIMSTRGQDQGLVEQTAHKIGIQSINDLQLNLGETQAEQNTQAKDLPVEQKRFMIPAFGWHPWFSHLIYDDRDVGAVDSDAHYRRVLTPSPDETFLRSLARPIPLSEFLNDTEQRLARYPIALIGEVGLDRSFRIPEGPSDIDTKSDTRKTGGDEGEYTPGSREGRPLTPYKVSMEQQKMVLKAQLGLAARYGRAASVHSVQAHGVVFEVMQSLWKGHERPSKRAEKKRRDAANAIDEHNVTQEHNEQSKRYPPRICMHSFSGPAEILKMFLDPKIPVDIYISFSECINFNGPASKKAAEVIKMVPEDRILVESDLHCAGHEMDKLLESIVRRVCEIKEWDLKHGAKILRQNWLRFIFGERYKNDSSLCQECLSF